MTINNANTITLATAAGWSSPVARQAHNLKVVGSNPTPATKYKIRYKKTPHVAYRPSGRWSRLDESSVAGQDVFNVHLLFRLV